MKPGYDYGVQTSCKLHIFFIITFIRQSFDQKTGTAF